MQIKSLIPNLMVEDVRRSQEFWCGKLGFQVGMSVDSERKLYEAMDPHADIVYAQFVCGDVEIMVQRRDSLSQDLPVFARRPPGGAFTLYLQVQAWKPSTSGPGTSWTP